MKIKNELKAIEAEVRNDEKVDLTTESVYFGSSSTNFDNFAIAFVL